MEVLIVVFAIAGGLVLFFITRELQCWYYKTNSIIGLLEEINAKLDSSEGQRIRTTPPSSVDAQPQHDL